MSNASLAPELAVERDGEAAVRAAARHALWRCGRLSYLLHNGRAPDDPILRPYPEGYGIPEVEVTERRGQLQAYEFIHRRIAAGDGLIVLKTGRQWGKSLLFTVFFAEMCVRRCLARQSAPEGQKPEPLRIPYAAPSGKQVEEFITPHFLMLRQHAPEELRPELHKGSWVFPDESRIPVAGCDDRKKADALRGPRAHAAALDEAGFVSLAGYVIDSVLGDQLLTTGGPMLISSTPPESSDHIFVDLWASAKVRGSAFESTTPEAPHMTAELLDKALERKGGIDSIAARRELYGLILTDPEQAVFPEWTDAVVREHPTPEHRIRYVVGDHGYEDMCLFAFGYYDFEADLDVIEAEVVLNHSTSDQIDAEVREMERQLWGETARFHCVDATPQVRADMSRARFQSIEVKPKKLRVGPWEAIEGVPEEGPEELFWQPVRKDDLHAAVNEVRVRLARQRIVVHPRCVTLRAHAEYARWNNQRTMFARPGKAGHHYDGAATLTYFVRMLDRAKNPIPVIRERPKGVSSDDWWVDPTKAAEEEAKGQIFTSRRRRGKKRRR